MSSKRGCGLSMDAESSGQALSAVGPGKAGVQEACGGEVSMGFVRGSCKGYVVSSESCHGAGPWGWSVGDESCRVWGYPRYRRG